MSLALNVTPKLRPVHASCLALAGRLSLEEAQTALLDAVTAIEGREVVTVLEGFGRVPFEDMHASLPQPPFDRVQVDGYALRHADIRYARRHRPVRLHISQQLYAGGASCRPLLPGEAARVTTGAMLPPGADCVIWQEDTEAFEDMVLVPRSLPRHRNCRLRGQDISTGQVLARGGEPLGAAALSLLAGQGWTHLPVLRKPRIGLLTTGDELFPAGKPLPPGKIYDVSSVLLAARIHALGAQLSGVRTCGDDVAALQYSIGQLLAVSDMVITTGGVSGGTKDMLPTVVSRMAAWADGYVLFHGLRIKPGSLTLGAVLSGKVVLGLSGNPVSAAAAFELLAAPLIKKLGGRTRHASERCKGIIQSDFIRFKKDAHHLIMAKIMGERVFLHPHIPGAGQLEAGTDFNCFVDAHPGGMPLLKGMEVDVILI